MKLKPLLIVLSLGAGLLAGCQSAYVITMRNGTTKLLTASKPKLVGGAYFYKDAQGNTVQISSSKVKSIEPK